MKKQIKGDLAKEKTLGSIFSGARCQYFTGEPTTNKHNSLDHNSQEKAPLILTLTETHGWLDPFDYFASLFLNHASSSLPAVRALKTGESLFL